MVFICYPKCSTCKKAQAWLKAQGLDCEVRDIQKDNPTLEELRQWHRQSGLPLKKFFNTSGQQYRALGLKDKLPAMTEEEQLALLATDGMLVKRPILLAGEQVLVGFQEAQWAQALLSGSFSLWASPRPPGRPLPRSSSGCGGRRPRRGARQRGTST